MPPPLLNPQSPQNPRRFSIPCAIQGFPERLGCVYGREVDRGVLPRVRMLGGEPNQPGFVLEKVLKFRHDA